MFLGNPHRARSPSNLAARQVNRYLALVCLLREENFKKHGLVDYNFHIFRSAIQEVCGFSQPTLFFVRATDVVLLIAGV